MSVWLIDDGTRCLGRFYGGFDWFPYGDCKALRFERKVDAEQALIRILGERPGLFEGHVADAVEHRWG